MMSLADKEPPSKLNELIDRVRAAAIRKPVDLRACWNWFYLCVMRDDHAGAFEASRRLAEASPDDPLALWAFLHTVSGTKDAARRTVCRLAARAAGGKRRATGKKRSRSHGLVLSSPACAPP